MHPTPPSAPSFSLHRHSHNTRPPASSSLPHFGDRQQSRNGRNINSHAINKKPIQPRSLLWGGQLLQEQTRADEVTVEDEAKEHKGGGMSETEETTRNASTNDSKVEMSMGKLAESAIQEATWSKGTNNSKIPTSPARSRATRISSRQQWPPTHPATPSASTSSIAAAAATTSGNSATVSPYFGHHVSQSPTRSDHSADAAAGANHAIHLRNRFFGPQEGGKKAGVHALGSGCNSKPGKGSVKEGSSPIVVKSGLQGNEIANAAMSVDSWENDICGSFERPSSPAVVTDDESENDEEYAENSSFDLEAKLKGISQADLKTTTTGLSQADDKSIASRVSAGGINMQPSFESECLRQNAAIAMEMDDMMAFFGGNDNEEQTVSEEPVAFADRRHNKSTPIVGIGPTLVSPERSGQHHPNDQIIPVPPHGNHRHRELGEADYGSRKMERKEDVRVNTATIVSPEPQKEQHHQPVQQNPPVRMQPYFSRSNRLSKRLAVDKRQFTSLLSVDEESEFEEPAWMEAESKSKANSLALKISHENDLNQFMEKITSGCYTLQDADSSSDVFSYREENSELNNSSSSELENGKENRGAADDKERCNQPSQVLPNSSFEKIAKERARIRREDTTPLRTNTSSAKIQYRLAIGDNSVSGRQINGNSKSFASSNQAFPRKYGLVKGQVQNDRNISGPSNSTSSSRPIAESTQSPNADLFDGPQGSDDVGVKALGNDGKARSMNAILDDDVLQSYRVTQNADVLQSYRMQHREIPVISKESFVEDDTIQIDVDETTERLPEADLDDAINVKCSSQQSELQPGLVGLSKWEIQKGRSLAWQSSNGVNEDEEYVPKEMLSRAKVTFSGKTSLFSMVQHSASFREHFRDSHHDAFLNRNPLYNPDITDGHINNEGSHEDSEEDDGDEYDGAEGNENIEEYQYDDFVSDFSVILENDPTSARQEPQTEMKISPVAESDIAMKRSVFAKENGDQDDAVSPSRITGHGVAMKRSVFEKEFASGSNDTAPRRCQQQIPAAKPHSHHGMPNVQQRKCLFEQKATSRSYEPTRQMNTASTVNKRLPMRPSQTHPHYVAPSAEVTKSLLEGKLRGLSNVNNNMSRPKGCGNSVGTSELGSILTKNSGDDRSVIPRFIFPRTHPPMETDSNRSSPSALPLSPGSDAVIIHNSSYGSSPGTITSRVRVLEPRSPVRSEGSPITDRGEARSGTIMPANPHTSRASFAIAAAAIAKIDEEIEKKRGFRNASREDPPTFTITESNVSGVVQYNNCGVSEEFLSVHPTGVRGDDNSNSKIVHQKPPTNSSSHDMRETVIQKESLKVASFWKQLDDMSEFSAKFKVDRETHPTNRKSTVVNERKATEDASQSSYFEAFEVAPPLESAQNDGSTTLLDNLKVLDNFAVAAAIAKNDKDLKKTLSSQDGPTFWKQLDELSEFSAQSHQNQFKVAKKKQQANTNLTVANAMKATDDSSQISYFEAFEVAPQLAHAKNDGSIALGDKLKVLDNFSVAAAIAKNDKDLKKTRSSQDGPKFWKQLDELSEFSAQSQQNQFRPSFAQETQRANRKSTVANAMKATDDASQISYFEAFEVTRRTTVDDFFKTTSGGSSCGASHDIFESSSQNAFEIVARPPNKKRQISSTNEGRHIVDVPRIHYRKAPAMTPKPSPQKVVAQTPRANPLPIYSNNAFSQVPNNAASIATQGSRIRSNFFMKHDSNNALSPAPNNAGSTATLGSRIRSNPFMKHAWAQRIVKNGPSTTPKSNPQNIATPTPRANPSLKKYSNNTSLPQIPNNASPAAARNNRYNGQTKRTFRVNARTKPDADGNIEFTKSRSEFYKPDAYGNISFTKSRSEF